jgi:predicted DNA-binding transcriptional regulator AlpA
MMSIPEGGLIRLKAVLHLLQISKSSFYVGIKAGRFPPPVHLGPRTSAWRRDDIMAIVAKGVEK